MSLTWLLPAGIVAWGFAALRAAVRRARVRSRLRTGPDLLVRAPDRLRAAVRAADLPVDADAFVTAWTAATLLSLVAASFFGSIGGALLVLDLAAPPALLAARATRRDARRRAELAPFADATASAVRGGASLPSALSAARSSVFGPLGAEIDEMTGQVSGGSRVSDAFSRWLADPDPDVRLTGRAITMVAEHGGRTAEALDRTATVLRGRHDRSRERSAMATQARSSAVVMTAAPVVFAVVSGIADPSTVGFLVSSPIGIACLTAGVGLDLAGAWWMSSLARRAA